MSIRKLFRQLLVLALFIPLLVGAATLKEGHPERYVVQKGDTLWDISEHFLSSPWLWPEIWYNNPAIDNPHLIYPGDVISLVYIDGEPRLTIRREDRVGATIKLSPKIREQSIETAIPAIPLDAIRPFLNASRIVDADTLEDAPYVIAGADERVMSSASDRIYVRRLAPTGRADQYAVVRRGDAYTDPTTREVLGIEAKYLGNATVQADGDPATLIVEQSNREILPGDRLLEPTGEILPSNFYPRAPEVDVEGRIIAVLDGVTQIGQYSVVALNVGADKGVKPGDVLAVYTAGRQVRDTFSAAREQVTLPDERAGELIIFRTFDRMSLGLVMEAQRAMHTMDAVRNP